MHEIVHGFADGYLLEDDVFIAYDEDAKANAKEGNRRYAEEVFAGTMVIARWDDQQRRFKSLSDEQIKTYSSMFHEPEEISKLEVMEALALEQPR